MEATLITAAVSIVVVIITAIVSFIGLIISKENKTSEFRQAWIDELRKDISDYIALTLQHAFYYSSVRSSNQGQARELINKHFSEESHNVESIYTRIFLRLNHTGEHKEILEVLQNSFKTYVETINKDNLSSTLSNYNAELRSKTVELLKTEWEKVKEGEPIFSETKEYIPILLGIIFSILILVIGFALFKVYQYGKASKPSISKFDCRGLKTAQLIKYQVNHPQGETRTLRIGIIYQPPTSYCSATTPASSSSFLASSLKFPSM